MLNPNLTPAAHHEFVRSEGGLFWSSTGFAVARYVSGMELEPLLDGSSFEPLLHGPRESDPTMVSLSPISHPFFTLQLRAWRQIKTDLALGEGTDNSQAIARLNSYGAAMKQEELQQVDDYSNVGFGLTDPQFTIHFASVVANASMAKLIDVGAISQGRVPSLNMADYAAILQSNWFSRLMHTGTAADFGYWAETGKFQNDYFLPVPRLSGLEARKDKAGKWLVAAGVADRRAMHSSMEEEKTTGCPVAYRHYTVEQAQHLGQRHAANLQALGHATLEDQDGGAIHVTLEQTSISAILQAWGGKILEYTNTYGEPRYDSQIETFLHYRTNQSGFQDVLAA